MNLTFFSLLLLPLIIFGLTPPTFRETAVITYQFCVEGTMSFLLGRYVFKNRARVRTTVLPYLLFSMLFFNLGEIGFNSSFITKTIEGFEPKYLEVVFYNLSFFVFAFALLRHFNSQLESYAFYLAAAVITILHFYLQYRFVLVPLESVYFIRFGAEMRISVYLYSALTAFVVAITLLYSVRTLDIYEHLFLQTMLALLAFDFGARYQIVEHQFQAMTWAQIFWALTITSFLVIATASRTRGVLIFEKRTSLAEWMSVRVLLGASISSVNIMILGMIISVQLLDIKNGVDITWFLGILVGLWFISNSIAFRISKDLQAVNLLMPHPRVVGIGEKGLAKLRLQPVQRRTLLFEIDHMIDNYNELIESTNALLESLVKKNSEAALGRLAAQVAHDIRSPLAAFNSVLGELAHLPEEVRVVMRGAIFRVQDIANQLLEHNRLIAKNENGDPEVKSAILLSSLIEEVTSEKRTQFRSKLDILIEYKIHPNAYGLFVEVKSSQFKCILSNLINNAVESISRKGAVVISLELDGDEVSIAIRDNGRGIPPHVLIRLGVHPITYEKKNGNGIGIYTAALELKLWNGKLSFESRAAEGTKAKITLPAAKPPRWFLTHIELSQVQIIVILDDEVSMHRAWSDRLNKIAKHVEVLHFSTPEDLRQFGNQRQVLYLIDYELLGHQENGIDLILALNLAPSAVLVTSYFEEEQVLNRCLRSNIKLLPKSVAAYIPIV